MSEAKKKMIENERKRYLFITFALSHHTLHLIVYVKERQMLFWMWIRNPPAFVVSLDHIDVWMNQQTNIRMSIEKEKHIYKHEINDRLSVNIATDNWKKRLSYIASGQFYLRIDCNHWNIIYITV